MNFGERAVQKKKSKDLKNERKKLKKELLSAGCDKVLVNSMLKEFSEAVELGNTLQTDYEMAGMHLRKARDGMIRILECMGECSVGEVQAYLQELLTELGMLYHDCLIREDDMDFGSTIASLKKLVQEYGEGAEKMSVIMLRSEIENIKAVLDDTAGWAAPDFLALAYFYLHKNKDELKDKENTQRNQNIKTYFSEQFMDGFCLELDKAGCKEKVNEWILSYIYE